MASNITNSTATTATTTSNSTTTANTTNTAPPPPPSAPGVAESLVDENITATNFTNTSEIKYCLVNSTEPPLNWTEAPPPAPPGGWPRLLNDTEASMVPPPPSPPPLSMPPAPSPPSPPPDVTLNITYSPPPAPRMWEVLVPCNITAYVPPPAAPLLIFGLLDPVMFVVVLLAVFGGVGYYFRRRHLKQKLLKSLELASLESEVHKSKTLRKAKKMFDEMDRDGSGSVDLREFSHLFAIDPRSAWGERLMAVFDTDGNGTVSFREFVVGMGMLGSRNQEGDPVSNFCFKLIDTDKSGSLSRDELLSIVWQYVQQKEAEAHRAEKALGIYMGKKMSEVDDEETATAVAGRTGNHYRATPKSGNQSVEKLKKRGNDLEELMAWAEEEGAGKNKQSAVDAKESAAQRKRRERLQKIRKTMQGAIILLRQEYEPSITPRDFERILKKVADPFRDTVDMFYKLKPYMVPCAKVVDAVPGLRLDEMRAAHSAAIWKEAGPYTTPLAQRWRLLLLLLLLFLLLLLLLLLLSLLLFLLLLQLLSLLLLLLRPSRSCCP